MQRRSHHSPNIFLLITLLAMLASCAAGRKTVSTPTSVVKPAAGSVVQPSATGRQSSATTVRQSSEVTSSPSQTPFWGNIGYDGRPWVTNESRPLTITEGLDNSHVALWASHGRYWNVKQQSWRWQRLTFFGTCEDLFTQTIVVPYLIPMLERAGANVFTPRERDWQRHEVVVDNDDSITVPYYTETGSSGCWQDSGPGYRAIDVMYGTENPFVLGTARAAKATKNGGSEVSWQPHLPVAGRYAVYVSYAATADNVDDAHYTVWHRGRTTDFTVNQRMGAGTWVYLGTFDFDAGCNAYNRVVLTNASSCRGTVTADAVRFGGGMGSVAREGQTSHLPRCLEGARYYAQYAGAPYNIYSTKGGADDYGDDINVRSLMTNWLAGGSCYVPQREGLGVPIELSLAVHSDAGYERDGLGMVGTLAICTTSYHEGRLGSGVSRDVSKDFATQLLDNLHADLSARYGRWAVREVYDRNYSETRLPEIPSAIIETLSHQNFPDMVMGQDPNVRFTLARSLYKTILRFIASGHGRPYTVSPLPPVNFAVEFSAADEVTLRWDGQDDPVEPSARATSYILYISADGGAFDNGTRLSSTACRMRLRPGVLYSFRVTAANKGGESFPSETLCAVYHPEATKTVMIVNGFGRLSAPAVIDTADEQGFDLERDAGVSYGPTLGWSGPQLCFDKTKMGIEGPGGLGNSSSDWQGTLIAGNDFDHVCEHAAALMAYADCNVASSSRGAVEAGKVSVMKYHCVDLLLGLEKNDAHAMVYYKTFTPALQRVLKDYLRSGGTLLASGAYLASDMTADADRRFLGDMLKTQYGGSRQSSRDTPLATVSGMGTTLDYLSLPNEHHYAAQQTDILLPVGQAFSVLTYADGRSAAVAYSDADYKLFVMGFPLECIVGDRKRSAVMRGIMNFLLQ